MPPSLHLKPVYIPEVVCLQKSLQHSLVCSEGVECATDLHASLNWTMCKWGRTNRKVYLVQSHCF